MPYLKRHVALLLAVVLVLTAGTAIASADKRDPTSAHSGKSTLWGSIGELDTKVRDLEARVEHLESEIGQIPQLDPEAATPSRRTEHGAEKRPEPAAKQHDREHDGRSAAGKGEEHGEKDAKKSKKGEKKGEGHEEARERETGEQDAHEEPSASEEPEEPTPRAASGGSGPLARNPGASVQVLGGFENGGFSEFSATSTSHGSIDITGQRAFAGSRSALLTVRSPAGFAYSRVQQAVNWSEGDDIRYGAAVYLEPGFKRNQGNGSVDILRWDNWSTNPNDTSQGGLAVTSGGDLVLQKEHQGNVGWQVVLGPYPIPEGQWVYLEVRQRLSRTDGQAVNEVWIDGDRVGGNATANYFGRPITRHRVGIIGTPDPQAGELRMHIDDVTIGRGGEPLMIGR